MIFRTTRTLATPAEIRVVLARCGAVFLAAFVLSALADRITAEFFGNNFCSSMDDAMIGSPQC